MLKHGWNVLFCRHEGTETSPEEETLTPRAAGFVSLPVTVIYYCTQLLNLYSAPENQGRALNKRRNRLSAPDCSFWPANGKLCGGAEGVASEITRSSSNS